MPEGRVIPPIRVMRNRHSNQRSDSNVVDVVSVVFATGNGNESSAKQGHESQQDASEVSAGTVNVALACNEEGKVPQTAEGETTMPAGKAAPSVVQGVMIRLGTDLVCDELVGGRTGRGLASRNEVWSRSTDGVLDHVGDEAREDQTDDQPENGNMCFVCPWAEYKRPYDKYTQGHGRRVDEQPSYWHTLDFGMGVIDSEVIEEEHAMEGFDE